VEARPVLRDKTDNTYKDRDETKKAWTEVYTCLARICTPETAKQSWGEKKEKKEEEKKQLSPVRGLQKLENMCTAINLNSYRN